MSVFDSPPAASGADALAALRAQIDGIDKGLLDLVAQRLRLADQLAALKTEAPGSDEGRIRRAYQLLYSRPAMETQVRLAREFLGSPANDDAWTQYAHVLLGSNEFLFVD